MIISAYTIPLTIGFTGVPFSTALALDVGGIAFFVVFATAYNAIFDAVMLSRGAEDSN